MNRINVISVNPGQNTLGALNPENFVNKTRENLRYTSDLYEKVEAGAMSSHKKFGIKKRLNFFFGINSETGVKTSAKLLVSRVLFAAYLISWSLLSLSSVPVEVVCAYLVVGGLLLIGLFSRVATFCGFMASSAFVAMQFINNGILNESLSLLAISCLVFSLLGPGRISVDSFLRKKIFRISKLVAIKKSRRIAEDRLSYKAFSMK